MANEWLVSLFNRLQCMYCSFSLLLKGSNCTSRRNAAGFPFLLVSLWIFGGRPVVGMERAEGPGAAGRERAPGRPTARGAGAEKLCEDSTGLPIQPRKPLKVSTLQNKTGGKSPV